jgi:hypothetical protein
MRDIGEIDGIKGFSVGPGCRAAGIVLSIAGVGLKFRGGGVLFLN